MDRRPGHRSRRRPSQPSHSRRRVYRTHRKEAPRMKPYLALIRNDVRLAYRQKAVIFFNYLLPLAFFFLFSEVNHADRGGAIVQVITMVLVIGILGNGLMGGGMRAVQERENNILRRYK